MTDDLERRLRALDAPREEEAGERTWAVVRAAFAEREPVPRPRHRFRPVVVVAAAVLALLAAAFTSPVRAVIDEVREAIGVEHAQPALFSLPGHGQLLVTSEAGPWVVRPDGGKRLLGTYRDASWSPYGQFVVAARRREVAALEPGGRRRWSLARPEVAHPRWGGTRTDTRVAYLSGSILRVVAGDGTGDRALATGVRSVAPAWRPGGAHVLAFSDLEGRIAFVETDSGRMLGRSPRGDPPRQLAWSPDGRRLVALSSRSLRVLDARGRVVSRRAPPRGTQYGAVAFAPVGTRFAVLRRSTTASEVALDGRRVFVGPGHFTDLVWSPDGRWLLAAWKEADQWVFIRVAGAREPHAVANIVDQFGSFPDVEGWCCR